MTQNQSKACLLSKKYCFYKKCITNNKNYARTVESAQITWSKMELSVHFG